MLIILIGFPKAGTSSLHHLFKQLGMDSSHGGAGDPGCLGDILRTKYESTGNLLDDAPPDAAWCELTGPWHWPRLFFPQLLFRQMAEERPDTLFILNYRNPDSLLSSWRRWSPNLCEAMLKYRSDLLQSYKGSADARMKAFMVRHYCDVRSFFAERSDLKFIEIDIEDGNIEPLGRYLDLGGITKLPHCNKNVMKPRSKD